MKQIYRGVSALLFVILIFHFRNIGGTVVLYDGPDNAASSSNTYNTKIFFPNGIETNGVKDLIDPNTVGVQSGVIKSQNGESSLGVRLDGLNTITPLTTLVSESLQLFQDEIAAIEPLVLDAVEPLVIDSGMEVALPIYH